MRSVVFTLLLLLLVVPASYAGVNFVVDAQPLALLISPDADGFSARRSSSSYSYTESIKGTGSFMPNLKLGIGIDAEIMQLDVTGGGGILWNAAFSAPLARADVSARFKLGPAITLGPHAGIIYFGAPKWAEDAQLDFSSTTGIMGGLDFTVGKKVYFLLSLDYVNAAFDVKPKSGWTVNQSELDMSGVALQLGVKGRF